MPLRFRRVAGCRFQKIRPLIAPRFTAQLPVVGATATTRRGQRQSQHVTVIYPTKRSRELHERRFKFAAGVVTAFRFKCRLAVLPLKTSFAVVNRKTRKAQPKYVVSNSAHGGALLQHALRQRFAARDIRDLRKSGRRRRLPRYQFTPF
jgi:hypothetical protein